MLKVVLVEDESVIREGIRDTIPWEEYGFRFAGEAADGEMALSVIRQTKPDLLITDIKMPFMDGLSLSRMVHEEFPHTKIIIISGYDDFEYAREAISVGVDQYLLKPITKHNLKKALVDIREKIEADQQQNDYQTQYSNEMHEYERFNRRRFFENIFEGSKTVREIYEEAAKLEIEMTATSYNLILFLLKEKQGLDEENADIFHRKQDEIIHFILRHPQYVLFSWNVDTYGVLIKGEKAEIETETIKLTEKIRQVGENISSLGQWYVAIGKPVERLSSLPECYQMTNHNLAYRFLLPSQHILSEESLSSYLAGGEEQNIKAVDSAQMNPEIIREFLNSGNSMEIPEFASSYMQSIQEALKSNMFRDYVVLNIRFTIIAYVEGIGATQAEHIAHMSRPYYDMHLKPEEMEEYFTDMLQAAIKLRDKESDATNSKVLKKAMDYVDANYQKESISLNEVAAQVGVSGNYLSTIFSQTMEKTFVEYLTGKRIEKAKKLLKTTEKSSSEIALEVGYKDPHYFSFVFKKTLGVSPREYRGHK